MLNEFKQFIARGNVMDLAVGVIIGAAFSKIVESVVNDLVMPIVGALTGGGFDFSNYFLVLSGNVTATTLAQAREQGAIFAYGNFITVLINFLILAWIIFMMIKGVNRLRASVERDRREGKEDPAPPSADVQLLTEIRDLLRTPRT
jgi:large conductance mechanosensitive channel